jgi:hypothetical protein
MALRRCDRPLIVPDVLLRWDHGSLRVGEVGAMLREVVFTLPSGRRFSPFAKAAWVGGGGLDDLAPHLRELGAEFACLPFGVGGPLEEAADDWARLAHLHDVNDPPHGLAANAVWTLEEQTATRLRYGLDYPADHAIRRLERTLAVDPDRPALDLALHIEARRPVRISAGLHPILTLAVPEESLRLAARFAFGLTYPAAVPGGGMAAAIGRTFERLDAVPAAAGGTVNLSRLPKAAGIEDVVQLCGVEGPVEIAFTAESARLVLDWDRSLLPSCQLWISDRALTSPPWNGGYRGLGVEPIASAFDLADACSREPNPISARGIATTLAVEPGAGIDLSYRIEAFEDR